MFCFMLQLSRPRLNCSLSNCLKRTRISLKETLALENVHVNLINSQRCCSNAHIEKCQETVLSCSSSPAQQNYLEQACPFDAIRLQSASFLYVSRISLSVHCNVKLISNYVTALNNINTIAFKREDITADSRVLHRCIWEDLSHYSYVFPRSISLDRGSCFNFSIFVYLNHSSPLGKPHDFIAYY